MTSQDNTEKPKRPASVLVVIGNLAGEILLLERFDPAGFWQSVTGSLAPGESPRAAAEREVYEETGLCCAGRLIDPRRFRRFPIMPPWSRRYAPGVTHNIEHEFHLLLPARRLIRLVEHRRYRWLPLDRGWELATSWTNREAIAAFRQERLAGGGVLSAMPRDAILFS